MEPSKSKWAIIDIGSNTIRLVIYHKNELGRFKETENIKAAARLRHYLNKNGVIELKGITLLIKILKGFSEVLEFHGVEHVKCVATAAIRQAVNKDEILKIVNDQTGFEIDILSEKEEAFYGYFAVIQTTPIDEGVTIDIGGGSTEITYFQNRQLLHSHSFPFGVVSLKEQFIKGEKITIEEKDNLLHFIRQSYQKLPWLKDLQVPIIAIGGSARNVAQIDQNMKNYPLSGIHQYTMTPLDLNKILSIVERLKTIQVEKLEGLSKDRADLILPALEVFVQLSEYAQSEKFMFSGNGLRDGIFLKEYEHRGDHIGTDEVVKRSITELVFDYQISTKHSGQVAYLAKQIYSQLETKFGISLDDNTKMMIDLSAHVYYLGQYVDPDVCSQHTFYLLANTSINGLEHKDRLKLALIASFKNKALLKQYCGPFANWFTREELQEIRIAGALTKLAAALDASKRGIVKSVFLQKTNENEGSITIKCIGNHFIETYQAEKQIKHLEKGINKEIKLIFLE
jgi:exopolyphosphatase / guanosine-5'-triphosphate,3'-diphosphate pyrophosphatase